MAERWRELVAGLPTSSLLIACADDPIAADLVREHARRRAALRDRRSRARATRAAARGRLALVRALRARLRLRHRVLRRTSATTAARAAATAGRRSTSPPAASSCWASTRPPSSSSRRSARAGCGSALPGLYNVYNALAAASLCLSLGVPLDEIRIGLGRFRSAFGRFQRIALDDRRAVMLLSRTRPGRTRRCAPCATGDSELTALVALNDRTADGRDVSWIWDVDWEAFAGSLGHVVVAGTRADDLALRLKYAGVPVERLHVERDLVRALDRTPRSRRAGRHRVPPADVHRHARAAARRRRPRPGQALLGGVRDVRLVLCQLYPAHLSIYADRGNVQVLRAALRLARDRARRAAARALGGSARARRAPTCT